MVEVKVGCRRLAAGEPDAAAEVVLAVSATEWVAETTGVELRMSRSSWWSPLASGWPKLAPAMSLAAAEARVQVGIGLRCANERGEVPRRLYAMRGARWAHARDQMVTGATPTLSSGGGAFRP